MSDDGDNRNPQRSVVRLRHWSRAHWEVAFDPVTGSGKTIFIGHPPKNTPHLLGFAGCEYTVWRRRTWFALYCQDDGVVLSTGSRQWRLGTPGLEFRHSHPAALLSRFSVYEQGRCTYTLTYTHLTRRIVALLDPTYDQIDYDTDFPLDFIARQAGDDQWRREVAENWKRPDPDGDPGDGPDVPADGRSH